MQVFTDGSLRGRLGGWAVVERGGKVYGGTIITDDSYEPELRAIKGSLEHVVGDFSITTDHTGIANELNRMLHCEDWKPPEKYEELWSEIQELARDRLQGAAWAKRNSTPEMRKAHNIASARAGGRYFG
jgi:ribonuclease HI